MNDVTDLTVVRARREGDNRKISPADLLQMMLADIREGRILVDALLVGYASREDGAIVEFNAARCGLSRLEEVGLLELMVHQAVAEARSGK